MVEDEAFPPKLRIDDRVQLRVTSDYVGVSPGQTILFGFTFFIEEGWHTYWPGASDSGFGMTHEFSVPGFMSVADPIWPTPSRHLAPGDILDHVYEGEFTVLVPMMRTAEEQWGDHSVRFEMQGSFDYLVCKDLCLPGSAGFAFGTSMYPPDLKPEKTESYDRLHELYDNRVKPLSESRPDATVEINEGTATISVPDASSMVFYPSSACAQIPDLIGEGEIQGDTITLHFKPQSPTDSSGPAEISGRLEVIDQEGVSSSYDFRHPVVNE